jgi:hypothetical protein
MIVDGFDVELSCPESEEALYEVLDGLEMFWRGRT